MVAVSKGSGTAVAEMVNWGISVGFCAHVAPVSVLTRAVEAPNQPDPEVPKASELVDTMV